MATIPILVANDDNERSSTSTTFVDVNAATEIPAASFVDDGVYLMFCTARIGGSDKNSTYQFRMVLGTTPTEIAQSAITIEVGSNSSSAAKDDHYQWWDVVTQPATAEDLTFQFAASATNTVYAGSIVLAAMRLDADLVENSDWRIATDTSLTTHTTSWVAFADTGTYTPPTSANKRLVLGHVRFGMSNVNLEAQARLMESIAGGALVERALISIEGEDTAEEINYSFAYLDASGTAGSRRYVIETQDDGGGTQHEHIASRVFVLEEDSFTDFDGVHNAGDLAGTNAPQTIASLTGYTPASVVSHLVIGGTTASGTTADNYQINNVLDTVDVDGFDNANSTIFRDATDQPPGFRVNVLESLAAASHTIDIKGDLLATTSNWQNRLIFAVGQELEAAPAGAALFPPFHRRTRTQVRM